MVQLLERCVAILHDVGSNRQFPRRLHRLRVAFQYASLQVLAFLWQIIDHSVELFDKDMLCQSSYLRSFRRASVKKI